MEKILIDTPMCYPKKKEKWSHLVASDLETLHAFAQKLGKPREKFQNKRKKNKKQPHYDIEESLYALAVANGAQQVSRKELFLFLEATYNSR
jgi:hypothetical protein